MGLALVAVTVSEAFIFAGLPEWALWGHFVTLVACSLAPLRFEGDATVFRALALVPLFRLVNLGMPVFAEPTIYWFPLVYGALIPGMFLLSRTHDIDIRYGWRVALLALPLAIPLSALLASLEHSLITPEALVSAATPDQLLLIGVVMVCFVGFVEEFLFRGILQDVLERRYGRMAGLLLTSALFGLLHAGYGLQHEILFAGVIGLLFGVVYDWTDSLVLVTLLHGLLNVFLFAIIPIYGSVLGPFGL
ncbi:CPBP family intramembrane glutamic endopeptidase [Halomarina litorea]|uniref:CPBP family intramembrane glutamic endopeptidase n=1 Tax=Halomarina litorea TaxID=2961595 RepID=UPI0020C2297A|nr:CPBP family intramembrane glutamic endopeptidase [Halomarina sp. BCD28]